MSGSKLIGRIWVISDSDGNLIENIDTDQIFHNQHLHITDQEEMGQYAFGNLAGWKDFSQKVLPGDILVTGRNFGSGSSRQQAVDCFLALKVQAVLAVSFGAIYFRNAVNSGLPVLISPDLPDLIKKKGFRSGDSISLDMERGEGRVKDKEISFNFRPVSRVQIEIYRAGGLFPFGKTLSES